MVLNGIYRHGFELQFCVLPDFISQSIHHCSLKRTEVGNKVIKNGGRYKFWKVHGFPHGGGGAGKYTPAHLIRSRPVSFFLLFCKRSLMKGADVDMRDVLQGGLK